MYLLSFRTSHSKLNAFNFTISIDSKSQWEKNMIMKRKKKEDNDPKMNSEWKNSIQIISQVQANYLVNSFRNTCILYKWFFFLLLFTRYNRFFGIFHLSFNFLLFRFNSFYSFALFGFIQTSFCFATCKFEMITCFVTNE